jgi:hypothetical protein
MRSDDLMSFKTAIHVDINVVAGIRFDGQLDALDHDAQVQLPTKSAKIRHF